MLHEMNKMKQEDSAVDAMLFTLQKRRNFQKVLSALT